MLILFFGCYFKKLKDVESIIRIEEVDGSELAQEFSDEIEKMLGSKMKSVKVSMSMSRALGHTMHVQIKATSVQRAKSIQKHAVK